MTVNTLEALQLLGVVIGVAIIGIGLAITWIVRWLDDRNRRSVAVFRRYFPIGVILLGVGVAAAILLPARSLPGMAQWAVVLVGIGAIVTVSAAIAAIQVETRTESDS